jgi:hypothetical protein
MSDLVERLRSAIRPEYQDGGTLYGEAADRIEELESQLAALRAQKPVLWMWIEDPFGANEVHVAREPFDRRATPLYAAPVKEKK